MSGKRITFIWFLLTLVAVVLELLRHKYNNYLIYKGVFTHIVQQTNLYTAYPSEYFDTNHYGPLFSLIIAPFALLPNSVGVILWALANAAVLYWAISLLPIEKNKKQIILLFSVVELMTSIHNVQFNPTVAAMLILSYVMVEKEQDIWATLFIAIGFMVKLYGIGGIAFFWFSKHKVKFVASFIGWLAVLFVLPMSISSPRFIVQSYQDWYEALVEKNVQNNVVAGDNMQDISVSGMVKRIFNLPAFSISCVLVPATLIFGAAFLRIKQYAASGFRLIILASILLMIVLFSSSSESPTYVIAVVGVGIWWAVQANPSSRQVVALMLFVLILTSFSATDLFPHFIRKGFIVRFALKALPCFVVWLVASKQLLTNNFLKPQSTLR